MQAPPLEYEWETGYPGAPESEEHRGGRTARRLLAAYQRNCAFMAAARHPEMLAQIAMILASDRLYLVRAHHNCLMTKRPLFSSSTGWHRDLRYWHFDGSSLVNAWIPLTAEHARNGALRLLPGSHLWSDRALNLSAASFLDPATSELSRTTAAVQLDLKPGDLLLFHAGLFHSAGANTEGATKMSLVYAYHTGAVKPIANSRSSSLGEVQLKVATAGA